MKAIDKMVEYLEYKENTSAMFRAVWQDAKLEAVRLAAEEKAEGEGLREDVIRRELLKEIEKGGAWNDSADAVVVRLGYIQELVLNYPVAEQKAPAGLVGELEEIKLRMEAFFSPDGNPPEDTGEFRELKGAIKMIEYVIRSLEDRPCADRPAADRTEELVKKLRELADVGCGEGLGFLCVRNMIYEILADYEKGAM